MKINNNSFELNDILLVVIDSSDNDGLIFIPNNIQLNVEIENYFGKIMINKIEISSIESEFQISKNSIESHIPNLDIKLLDRYIYKILSDKSGLAILFGFTATLLIGGFLALDGEIKVATYSVLLFITQRLLWPLTELGDTFDLYQRAMASFNRIFSLKNESSEIGNGDIEFKKLENRIELKDVSFSYVDNFNVLNNVDLTIETGQTTAIVGSTGSGKSTLIKLLLRLYEINNGSISYDSNSLKDIELSSLREKIGLVSQDVFLFEGTVIENIAYGDLNASESEVWNAAQKSEADEFINNLPQKEKTIVGERGQKLSGGQRQRISIARAILKNPEILILDEATSSVDNETEAAIQRSLDILKKDRTVIVIAHRLSTVRNADIIYVLENGSVVESGNHESLLDIDGVYSKLWSVQTGEKI